MDFRQRRYGWSAVGSTNILMDIAALLAASLSFLSSPASGKSPETRLVEGTAPSVNAEPSDRDDEKKSLGPQAQAALASKLAVGDRLRMAFYSTLASSSDAESAKEANLSSLIERQDMAGDYVVQLDGTIFLPFLGKVDAAGQSEADLLSVVEKKAIETFRGTTKVNIRLVEREPVYVTGDVPQPGAFKYSPGMMVMHAAALGGVRNVGPNGPDIGSRLTVVRESAQLSQSQIKVADLIAQRDVLIAMRPGGDATPSADLKRLVGSQDAADRIAAAKRVSDLEASRLADEQKAFADNLAMLNQERSHLTQALNEAEKSLKFHAARFSSVSEMHNRGVMTDATYDVTRNELDSSRARWNDVLAALSRLEGRILETGQQKSKSLADAAIARERKINELQSEIQQAMVVQSALEPVLGFPTLSGASRREPLYRIVRRFGNGAVDEFEADKFAALMPGDIVEVIQSSRDREAQTAKEPLVVGRGH